MVALPVALAFGIASGLGAAARVVRRHCGGVLRLGIRRHEIADIRDHEVVIFDFSGATYLDQAREIAAGLLDDRTG